MRPYNLPLMSQITRCPSCSTSFKVVADQLRISHGWVRCGQCQEVFDASANLLPVAPPALLPDVSLTDVRPPFMPVARKSEVGRSWGESPSSPPPVDPPVRVHSSAPAEAALSFFPEGRTDAMVVGGSAEVPADASVLEVPQPAVPAFLSAAGALAPGDDVGMDQLAPFAWRPRPVPNVPATDGGGAAMRSDSVALPPLAFVDAVTGKPLPQSEGEPTRAPLSVTSHDAEGETSVFAGYDPPSTAKHDHEEVAADAAAPAALTPMGYPALELPAKAAVPKEDTGSGERAAQPLPAADVAPRQATPEPEPEALALQEDRSPAAVLQAPTRNRSSARKSADVVDEDDGSEAGQEVSFVVAARRKAFWRKPLVRGVLGVLLVLSAVGLALQVAMQERDRLAAMDARTKPWLAALCAPLQCEISLPRQIAHVVIDSSSFNKARGDSYQLALTLKSKASMALAMPAVELTLTDAQDQPVLRRILLPTDMGAPMELPAGGEWSTSVSVIVTTGGARVAGYRLLAFYP